MGKNPKVILKERLFYLARAVILFAKKKETTVLSGSL